MSPFEAVGSFSGGGTFTATGYTVSGSFTLTSPESASGSFSGTATYDLAALIATADGTYDGTAQTSEFGDITINGSYSGNGSIALTPAAITASQLVLPTNLLGGIASPSGLEPIVATALDTSSPRPRWSLTSTCLVHHFPGLYSGAATVIRCFLLTSAGLTCS